MDFFIRVVWFALGITALATLATPRARAEAKSSDGLPADRARLGLLSRTDREILDPYLERGPVALVEFSGEAELPAIIFAHRVRAPASKIARLLGDPRRYPRFMPALESVEIRSRRDRTVAYGWTWRTAVFTLQGHNVLSVYPAAGPGRPWRVESRHVTGDLGSGRTVWRVYPTAPDQSLLVLSTRMDLREANYVARALSRGKKSVNRTINLTLALAMLQATRREAERDHPRRASTRRPRPALTRPDVSLTRVAPLLRRGDLLLLDMVGDRLDRVTVVGKPGASAARVREVLTDPREFGPALMPGSYARVHPSRDHTVTFDWGVDIPLVGTSGRMRLVDTGSTVRLDATEGALRGGRWRWEVGRLPNGEPLVLGWARFDPRTAGWLIGALVQANPDFGHGIAAGSEIMVLRAIRSRAQRRHERRAAQARAD